MHRKAREMGDHETALKILAALTPRQAKQLGRDIKNFSEQRWSRAREGAMQDALRLKVDQHPLLREALLQTGDALIAEASPFDHVRCVLPIVPSPDSY